MNSKITITLATLLVAASMTAQVQTVKLNISGGDFMGSPIPDYTRWYYFSFAAGDTIGSSEAVLENVNPANIGAEVIDAGWQARTDWDIAFHAGDIRTNSAASGSGQAGALKIADAESATPLDETFAALTKAPASGYTADELLTGAFIFGMAGMPPLRTTQLSASAAAAGWAAIGMGGNTESPRIIVFRTADDHYAKVYLKKFFDEEGIPGIVEFDFEMIPADGSQHAEIPATDITIHSGADAIHVHSNTPTDIRIYSISGALVGHAVTPAGQSSLATAGWAKGIYVVKATSSGVQKTQKIAVGN
ncbi:MAG: T9SS type A sorting domain-containing protein [Tannerella sp.]|jgi:hypothetical protein|nr:T9SS type A sorting domain-containing protein [Tannerella sp.]